MTRKLSQYEKAIIAILKSKGLLSNESISKTLEKHPSIDNFLGDSLLKEGTISKNNLQRAIAEHFNIEILEDLVNFKPTREVFKLLTYELAKKHSICPLSQDAESISIALCNPLQVDLLEELQVRLRKKIKSVYADEAVILKTIDLFYLKNKKNGELEQDKDSCQKDENSVYDLLSKEDPSQTIQILNKILRDGIHRKASDIHFEPTEKKIRIRFRIDGVLQEYMQISPEHKSSLLTRIKVISQLDIAEKRLPQDGRIKLKMGGREIDFRVSTVPVVYGERIVLRILDKDNIMLGLNKIGMPYEIIKRFRKLLKLPEGILLVTGPTGSGKTTTLYSALNELCHETNNIMTIEDPVEYKLPNIAQIAVQPKIKLNFATGLRHILRQDPDIIMVGEIRDRETAKISIQSSLTGHLVLSTLHTNDAPSAITRLTDMSIEPYLISSSLAAVLAQRLVRKICPFCKEPYTPREEELASIGLNKEIFPAELYHGKGCQECFHTGYKGRHGIYELLIINDEIKQALINSADATLLRKIALKHGMSSLLDHGVTLVQEGTTSIAEILRVTRGVEEII